MRILGRTAAATILLTGFPPTFLAGYAKRHEMKLVAYVALIFDCVAIPEQ